MSTMTRYTLYRGTQLLGTITYDPMLGDFPWHGGHFQAGEAYGEVQQLFQRELALLDSEDDDAWEALWSEITSPGLRLQPDDGGAAISELLIHIDGAHARWRY